MVVENVQVLTNDFILSAVWEVFCSCCWQQMVRYKYKSDYLWSIKYLSAPLQASIFRYIELDGTELVELVASSTKALWDVGQLYTYFYFFCMNSQTVSSGNRSYLTASHHNRPCLTHFCLE